MADCRHSHPHNGAAVDPHRWNTSGKQHDASNPATAIAALSNNTA